MFICSKDSFGGLIFRGGGDRRLIIGGSYYRKELYVSKLFGYVFRREAASEKFWVLCIQE